MKIKTNLHLLFALVSAAFLTVGSFSIADQTLPEKTTKEDIKKEVTGAVQSIKGYSVNQRDEAIKKAKALMDDLDARIESQEAQLDKKWEQLDQAARQKGRDALKELRKQRNEVAEWYYGLKHSSTKAWKDVKKGFLDSYKVLQDSFNKAVK